MRRQHWTATRRLALVAFLTLACGDSSRVAAPFNTNNRIAVSPRTGTLEALGDTLRLSAALKDGRGLASPTFSWTSLSPEVASVDAQGQVVALRRGETRIVVRHDDAADTALIVIVQTPASVVVRRGDGSIVGGSTVGSLGELDALGDAIQLEAEIRDRRGNQIDNATSAWSTLNPEIVEVNTTGTVYAAGNGEGLVVSAAGKAADTAKVSVSQKLTKLELYPSTASLRALGDTLRLRASTLDKNGREISTANVSFRSLAPGIVAVDASGRLTARSNGSTRIIASAASYSDTTLVSVQQTVASVTISPASVTIVPTQVTPLSAVVRDAAGTTVQGANVAWTSSNTQVATVDALGRITGINTGTATVTASLSGFSAASAVTVSQTPVASISISPSSGLLAPTQTLQFIATVRDANYDVLTGRPITWTSSNPSVATIIANGLVTAVADGNATITASAEGRSASVAMVVFSPIASIVLQPTSLNLVVGSTQQVSVSLRDASGNVLANRTVTWSTSNTSIARVSTSGVVTAVAAGSATVIALSEGRIATDPITVTAAPSGPTPVASVTVSPSTSTLQVGGRVDLLAVPRDAQGNALDGRTFTWSSSNTSVATVNSSGVVTAVATGTVAISATTDGKIGTAQITVAQASTTTTPTRVVASPAINTLNALGDVGQFSAVAYDAGGAPVAATVQWLSSNPAVATIDGVGRVTAKGIGTVMIVAAVSAACKDTVQVEVRQVVDSLTIQPAAITVARGSTVTVSGQAWDANGNQIATPVLYWATANASVATVDAAGQVTGVGAGATDITATAGSHTARTRVTVPQLTSAVTTVALNVGADTLDAINATTQLSANARDAAGNLVAGVSYTWTSSSSVATVNSSGLVTGKSEGTALIVATAAGSAVADTARIVVRQVPAAVTIQPGSASMAVGGTASLSASLRDANGFAIPNATMSWSTSAPAVATVATGTVTGVSVGTAVLTASSSGKSGTANVTVSAVPPPTVLPQGTFFGDGFESGDFSHRQNTMYWSSGTSVPAPGTIPGQKVFSGTYAGRSRHTASMPGGDIGDGPTEMRFRIAPINSSPYTKLWMEYYLYVPANHWHADKSSRGKQTWYNLSLQAGTTTVTGPAGTFTPENKGMPIAFPGAGQTGDDGVVAFIKTVVSDTRAELTGIYRYKLAGGATTVTDASHYSSQGAVAAIPTSVTSVTATKIKSSNNHKHFVLFGRAYSTSQQPHPYILAELWPEKNTDPEFGDSYLEVRYYENGYVNPGSSNGLRSAGITHGVTSSGVGLKRGQWNRVRIHADLGSGPGIADGVIQVWYGNDLVINRTNLLMYPNPVPGEVNTPYPWWDAGYINGWVNGGFMEDTDYYVDNFAMFLSNPGW